MIEVNRNSIIIRNVDVSSIQYKKFENAFSFYNKVTHKFDYSLFILIDKDIHCPATIGEDIIQTYFPNKKIIKNYLGSPQPDDITFNMKHKPRDSIQTEALSFLVSIKDDEYRWRMLNLATGSGKTFVSIAAISQIKQKTMIIVDSIDLANQWKSQFLYHSDLNDDDIYIISGMESIENKDIKSHKIYIAIYNTLSMLIDKDYNALNELNHKLKIGLRIFDESHIHFKSLCMINSLSNVNYTFFLTATPKRSDYRENILYSKIFKKVPSYNGHKEKNEKYHQIILVNFDSKPSDKQKASVKTKYGFSLIKWCNFLATDELYCNYIDSLFKLFNYFKFIEKNKKVAIVLPTINLINKTYDSLKEKYQIDIGKFVGEIKKKQRGEELNKKIFLTNEKIFGKGIDVPDLDIIINYAQISSSVNVEQLLGRLRNTEGHNHILIDMCDIGFDECKKQLLLRKRYYKKVAQKIIQINQTL